MKQNNNQGNRRKNSIIMAAVATVLVAVFAIYGLNNQSDEETTKVTEETQNSEVTSQSVDSEASNESDNQAISVTENEEGNIVISTSDIGENATFYQYDANGTTMEFFAVKASDGTIRTAMNTCQVCNGSPYAYFEQQGDNFQCQNCGNIFKTDMIELERNGCNPIPITPEDKTATDTEITFPATFLDEKADLFENWKKF